MTKEEDSFVGQTMQDDNGLAINRLSLRIILLILVLAFLLGGNAVATKIALHEISPFMIAGLRSAIGAISILMWSLLCRKELKPHWRDIP